MTWHANESLLRDYVGGGIEVARASSVEAHLLACAGCRAALGDLARRDAGEDRLDRLWAGVVDGVDAGTVRRGLVERLVQRIGVPDDVSRLLGATPSLRLSWLLAIVLALGFAVLASVADPGLVPVFLAMAPIAPVAGVAAAFGPEADPAYEVAMAAPTTAVRLLVVRALAVLAVTVAIAVPLSLALPGLDWLTVGWVLPALGLTATSVALASVTTVERGAALVTGAWLVAVVVSADVADDRLAAFRPAGQAVCALALAGAALVLHRRRDAFETRSSL